MSKVIPGIQGVSFKKVVSRMDVGNGWCEDRLACGHTFLHQDKYCFASKRRCYACPRKKKGH